MDIEYLLLLQRFREYINDFLTPFMEGISLFAVTYLTLVPAIVYWVYDKKKGLYPLASLYLCLGINATIKLTACIYRPWIRDARVVPAGDAIKTATGYSFPSGHTATAGPIYGGLAKVFYPIRKWIAYLLIALLLITGFSRNYLGVHTPQDVVVAMLESMIVLYAMDRIFKYVENDPKKENLLLLFEFLFAAAFLVYITYKPYPMQYVNGELIVDPRKMMNDGYGDIGVMLTYPIARFIEKKWIRFKSVGLNWKGLLTAVVGIAVYVAFSVYLSPYLVAQFGSHWGKLLSSVVEVLFMIVLYPALIRLFFNREEKENQSPTKE